MKYYTKDHVWLRPDNETGRLEIGITVHGNAALDNSITFVETSDGKLFVESVKKAFELELPVKGELYNTVIGVPAGEWDEDLLVASYDPGYELDTSQCMDEEAYRKYVE